MPDFSCPKPSDSQSLITMAHGAGGAVMRELISREISALYDDGHAPDHDGATFAAHGTLAFTTDSYVVKPLFFKGGDIGKLAVYGTVNDLAMCGAVAQYLSCSFILEEGLPIEVLQKVCRSLASAAKETGVSIVTGDTKVVGRGQADGLYINTSGVGFVAGGVTVHPRQVREGDVIILSGDIGRHGLAVMAAREHLAFDGDLTSDCAPLIQPIQALIAAGVRPKCLRDLTRGGLAAALHEIGATAQVHMEILEEKIPVHNTVRGASEILGIDPMYIANEGRFIAIVAADDSELALRSLKGHDVSFASTIIGHVREGDGVGIITPYGTKRILPEHRGELLPRIC